MTDSAPVADLAGRHQAPFGFAGLTHIELDSSPGNTAGFSRYAHSVLTHELRETPGHPAARARDEVVAFLRRRLSADPGRTSQNRGRHPGGGRSEVP